MKEKTEKLDKIIEQYIKEVEASGAELFYDFFVNPQLSMHLMVGPLEVSEGLTYQLATRIAEKNNAKVVKYDFSRGKWSEPPDHRAVFSVMVPEDESRFEGIVEGLCQTLKEFREASNQIIRTLGY